MKPSVILLKDVTHTKATALSILAIKYGSVVPTMLILGRSIAPINCDSWLLSTNTLPIVERLYLYLKIDKMSIFSHRLHRSLGHRTHICFRGSEGLNNARYTKRILWHRASSSSRNRRRFGKKATCAGLMGPYPIWAGCSTLLRLYNHTCLQLGQRRSPFRSMSNYRYVYPTSAKGAYLPAFIDTQDPRDRIPHQHQHLHCAMHPLALAPDGIHQQEAFASWQASDQLSHLCQYSMSFSFRTHSCRGPVVAWTN